MEDHRDWGVALEDHQPAPVVRWWERRPVDMTAFEWGVYFVASSGVAIIIGAVAVKVWA